MQPPLWHNAAPIFHSCQTLFFNSFLILNANVNKMFYNSNILPPKSSYIAHYSTLSAAYIAHCQYISAFLTIFTHA